MEDVQHHRSSRKGYRSHLTKLIATADELMNTNTDKVSEETKIKTATSLDSLIHQLSRKEKLLADLDAKILPLIDDESELETEVFETEEIQCKIAETVGKLKSFYSTRLQGNHLQSKHCEQPRSKLPEPQPMLPANPGATNNTESNKFLTLESSSSLPTLPSDSGSTNEEPVAPLQNLENITAPLSDNSRNREHVAVRLPKLTIPMFGGEPLD